MAGTRFKRRGLQDGLQGTSLTQHFHPLEIVSRCSDPQLQVGENDWEWTCLVSGVVSAMPTTVTWVWLLMAAMWCGALQGITATQPCPAFCKCLDKGSIVMCRQSQLPRVPRPPPTALVLDLDLNAIALLRNGSLRDASRLEILSLQNNGLEDMEPGAFQGLQALRVLLLGDNRLSKLNEDLLWGVRQLQVLDLHSNHLTAIPDLAVAHLHSLTMLNLSTNYITSAHLGEGFRTTTQLISLDLSANQIPSLETNGFQVMASWDKQVNHHLNLSFCDIRHIHPLALSHLTNLQALSLAGNSALPQESLVTALSDLEVSSLEVLNLSNMNVSDIFDFFRRFQHKTLLQLHLSHNNIVTIPQRAFFYLENLQLLDLSFNMISNVGDLTGLSKLTHLNLAFNTISSLDITLFDGLQHLHYLDLSHNSLSEITGSPFQNLFDLQHLDLSCNQIESLSIALGLEILDTLSISYNKIAHLDALRSLPQLKTLDLSHNTITQLGPNIFARGHELKSVNFSSNAIYEIDPQAFAGSSQELLDLSGNQLTRLAHYSWTGLEQLHLENNILSNASSNSLKQLTSLRDVYLQGNQLRMLPEGLFADQPRLRLLRLCSNPIGHFLSGEQATPFYHEIRLLEILHVANVGMHDLPVTAYSNLTKLRILDMSHNRIARKDLLQHLQHLRHLHFIDLSHNSFSWVDPKLLRQLPGLSVLDLSYNPFHCNCHLMPLHRWLFHTNVTVVHRFDRQFYQCSSPPEWTNIPLRDFHLESRTCSPHEKIVIFTALGSMLLALGVAIVFVLWRYMWRHKKAHNARYSAIDENTTVQVNHHTKECL